MVLCDLLNTPQVDQLYARRQLLKFLRELPPGQQVALFILSNQLRMVQSFTSSSDRLVAAAAAIDPKDFHFQRSTSQKMADDDLSPASLQPSPSFNVNAPARPAFESTLRVGY